MKGKSTGKAALSILLSLIMVLEMIPGTVLSAQAQQITGTVAFKEDGTTSPALEEGDVLKAGTTITVTDKYNDMGDTEILIYLGLV